MQPLATLTIQKNYLQKQVKQVLETDKLSILCLKQLIRLKDSISLHDYFNIINYPLDDLHLFLNTLIAQLTASIRVSNQLSDSYLFHLFDTEDITIHLIEKENQYEFSTDILTYTPQESIVILASFIASFLTYEEEMILLCIFGQYLFHDSRIVFFMK